MKDFIFYAPTEVAFGVNAESQLVDFTRKYKQDGPVLIIYGGGSARRSGLLDRIEKQYNDAGIAYVMKGGVQPNPRISLARECVDICRKEGVGLILAVGGGSVVDTAKATGYGVCHDGDVWDIYCGKAAPKASLPVGVVLTIPAAGSEMSDSSVLSNEETQQKLGCNSNICRCKFAIMNPLLSYSLPEYQTACGAVDIMMHTMERYFTKETDMLLTSAMAEALLRTVKTAADKLLCEENLSEKETYQARAAIMWASSLSHNDLMGRGIADFASHKIEHEISALYDVAHGAGLAAIWSSWARYVMNEDISRFVSFAVNVMGVENDPENPEQTALKGIEAMEAAYHSWKMPVGLTELLGKKVSEEDILLMANKCTKNGTFRPGYFKSLSTEDVAEILRKANSL